MRVEEMAGGKQGVYELERFQDGSNIKTVRRYISGDKFGLKGDVSVKVATPDVSYFLRKSDADYNLELLGGSKADYDKATQNINMGPHGILLRSPFYGWFENPLTTVLAMQEASITKVSEVDIEGQSVKRIDLHLSPYNEALQKGLDHIGGWLMFEPPTYGALRQFDLTYWAKGTGKVWARFAGSLSYGESVNDIPVLRRVEIEVYDANNTAVRTWQGEVKSVTFGSVSASEFSLPPSVLPKGYGTGTRGISFWIIALGILALVIILIVLAYRRWHSTEPTT